MTSAVTAIEPKFAERVWGANDLSPFFGQFERPVGEVAFEAGPLLIKFLFTTQPLSIQVHPDDAFAATHEAGSAGKTEMWHILRAQPGARIALGFTHTIDRDVARQAARDGSIEDLLSWWEVRAGDTFFTPARTVHALGAGLVVCEIQQRCEITYRLYDYDRGRALHLDKGFAVADLGPHPGPSAPRPLSDGASLLAECPFFIVERWEADTPWQSDRDATVILLDGFCSWGKAGGVWTVPQGSELMPRGHVSFIRTYLPDS